MKVADCSACVICTDAVKSGKYREGDERECEDPPNGVYDNFEALVDDLIIA